MKMLDLAATSHGAAVPSARAAVLVGTAVACAVVTLAGCLAPNYSVAEDAGSALDAAPVMLRWCSPMPALPPASNPPPDWECARESLPGEPALQVAINGTFNDSKIERIEYCTPPLHECQQLPYVPGSTSFSLPSNQMGNGIMYWHQGDTLYSATFWHSLVTLARLDVGSSYLYSRDEVMKYLPNIPLPDTQGAAVLRLRDCSGLSAAGARFVAVSAANRSMGTHFALNQVSSMPQLTPTEMAGTGGLINLDPGLATIYAYVGDGCIVAQASVIVEPDRVAYVFLVPNGFK